MEPVLPAFVRGLSCGLHGNGHTAYSFTPYCLAKQQATYCAW